MNGFKYRLWDRENKKMLYPSDFDYNDFYPGEFKTNTSIIALWLAEELSEDEIDFHHNYIGMQGFTQGLFVTMYEHDFIKLKSFPITTFGEEKDKKWKDWIFEVIWNASYTAFVGINIYDDSHDIIIGQYELEVIGNRFENPYILPEKEREQHRK